METRNCLYCAKPVRGRIDKKFCDDGCRNSHHNQSAREGSNHVRNLIGALRKNRRILASYLTQHETARATRERLREHGFLFQYHTHTLQGSRGRQVVFCFDHGYQVLNKDWVLIFKKMNVD
ncbi:MAG: hypothetical protein JNJ58_09435 [Chitinophagaceae bacterium]|nr:hypothetical protein [Chitinophagaceae bacterium]